MEKRNQLFTRTFKRLLVNQFDSCTGSLFQLRLNRIRSEGDVMDSTRRILFQEFGDGTFRIGRLQQFQMNLSDLEERCAHFLRGNFLAMTAFESERFFVIRNCLI